MLRIQRSEKREVVFTLSGQMDDEPIAQLETLINSETKGRRVILDLKDVTLVNENAIAFLMRCEANSITLTNCPGYVREWINAERREN
jgi:anti-anti-sigma regulatory factor